MFIVSPTRGGYRGDVVNSGFRQGRQDAYRDYIDNFNFALKADAANNAENQLNVERTARNYALQNGMRQGARDEAFNFVNDSTKIDNALTDNQISFVKNAELRNPETTAQLGQSQATQVRATQNANENAAAYKANQAQTLVEQQPLEASAREASLNNAQTQSEFSRMKGSMGMDATRFLLEYGSEKGYEPYIDRMVQNRAEQLVQEARARGEVLDPTEAERLVRDDHEFIRNSYSDYQSAVAQARNQHNLSKGYTTDADGHIVSTKQATSRERKPQQKAYKMGESFEQFVQNTPGERVNKNILVSGNTVYMANGQMITYPAGTDMRKKVQELAAYDTIDNVENIDDTEE